MAYCRWSDMDFKCDVYCYADCFGGWTTHIAATRVHWTPPEGGTLADLPRGDNVPGKYDEWIKLHKRRRQSFEAAEPTPIGLPHDGETFSDATLKDFRDRLTGLRDLGYVVPDYVFDEIDEELIPAPTVLER